MFVNLKFPKFKITDLCNRVNKLGNKLRNNVSARICTISEEKSEYTS